MLLLILLISQRYVFKCWNRTRPSTRWRSRTGTWGTRPKPFACKKANYWQQISSRKIDSGGAICGLKFRLCSNLTGRKSPSHKQNHQRATGKGNCDGSSGRGLDQLSEGLGFNSRRRLFSFIFSERIDQHRGKWPATKFWVSICQVYCGH